MVVGARELEVRRLVHLQRRRDVDHGQREHALTVVTCQAVRDARPAVVADEVETLMPERTHDAHHVERHFALAVVAVIRRPLGLARIAITAKVGTHHRVPARQFGRDAVPHRMRLRVAVQHEQRRPLAGRREVDRHAIAANPSGFKEDAVGHRRAPLPHHARSADTLVRFKTNEST